MLFLVVTLALYAINRNRLALVALPIVLVALFVEIS